MRRRVSWVEMVPIIVHGRLRVCSSRLLRMLLLLVVMMVRQMLLVVMQVVSSLMMLIPVGVIMRVRQHVHVDI